MTDEYMYKPENVFPFITNRKAFLLNEIPNYHPDSASYLQYWREQKRRCIEGFWAKENPNIEEWRYMPPNLYFYVNFGTILHKPDDAPRTAPKKKIRPYLTDIEWAFFYNFMEARGFSGFKGDDEYTANEDILKYNKGEVLLEAIHKSCFKPNGELKTYIPARDYIRKLWPRDMGLPLYMNEAKNITLLAARGLGKSFLVAVGVVLFEILFDGAREYTDESIQNPSVAEVFVGAANSGKSSDLLKKMKDAYDNLPGVWAKGTENERPSPFHKEMSGTLAPNNQKNPWRHEYPKKIAGKWQNVGSKSHIYHGIWTTENPETVAGSRPGLIIAEELGLIPNILTIHGCFAKGTLIRMFDGTTKPVEDITESDVIMGHDGTPRTINKLMSGFNKMYTVKQKNGQTYTVNNKHRLYLEQYRGTSTDGIFIEETETFVNKRLSKTTREYTYGIKSGYINFPERKLDVDPYYMGLYLGDGVVKSCGICYDPKTDGATGDWLKEYYQSEGLSFSERDVKGALLCSPISTRKGVKDNNKFRIALSKYNTLNKKYLHEDFLLNNRDNRLKLLAGLLDSDGTYFEKGNRRYYVFYQSGRKELVSKVEFLARSLGFRVSTCIHNDKRKGIYKERYQVSIYGDIHEIPCRLERKKAKIVISNYNRSTVRSSIEISPAGYSKYYGFKLNEDDRFLLADNTIVLNSNDAAQRTDGTDKFGSSIYIGTGGNIEKIVEAEIIFRDPSVYDMLSFNDEWENTGKIGWFIPATYGDRSFKDENGNTRLAEAETAYQLRRERKKDAKSRKGLDLEMMNYPLKPSEMFLNSGTNVFPVADIKQRYAELMTNHTDLANTWKGFYYLDSNGKVIWTDEHVVPIYQFPLRAGDDNTGCVHIFEKPTRGSDGTIPYGRYIAGLDPVDDDDNSDITRSLQSFFILDTFTDKLVLEYSARTRHASQFYEQVRRALIDYNAVVNYENQKKGFYGYMKNKNSLHYLAPTPEILKDYDMQKSMGIGNKSMGTSANEAVNRWGLELQIEWMEASSSNVEGATNLSHIKSPAYLRECISYDSKGNFDRISSMGLLMIYREDVLRRTQAMKKRGEEQKKSFGDLMLEDFERYRARISHNMPNIYGRNGSFGR